MSLEPIKSEWQLLGALQPKALQPAIEQIHHGVQFIAMMGKYFVENQPDDSHTNMEWLKSEEVLAGNWVKAPKGDFRLAMRPKDLQLIVYDSGMNAIDQCTLDGKTQVEACRWVETHLDQFGEDGSKMNLLLHYEIPNHETDEGAPFSHFEPALFAEMAKYRANSDLVLRYFAQKFETASPVRTWPHHFDNGTYIPMVFNKGGEPTRSFSLGFAIADSVVDEPYFYVTQWSAKKDLDYSNIPPLSKGEWLPKKLGGAALSASDVLASADAKTQAETVIKYFEEGIEASLGIIT